MTTPRLSRNKWLALFDVGDVHYLEMDKKAAICAMRMISAVSRYPAHMKKWRFKCMRVIGVPIDSPENQISLLRVERIR